MTWIIVAAIVVGGLLVLGVAALAVMAHLYKATQREMDKSEERFDRSGRYPRWRS